MEITKESLEQINELCVNQNELESSILKLLSIKYKNKDNSKKDILISSVSNKYTLLCYGGKFITKSEPDDKEKQCSTYFKFECYLYDTKLKCKILSYYIGRNYFDEFYFTKNSRISVI